MKNSSRLAVAALCMALVGCGAGPRADQGKAGQEAARQATALAAAASPATADVSVLSEISAAILRAGSTRLRLHATMAGQSLSANGDIALGAKLADSRVAMTIDLARLGSARLRLVGSILYVNAGSLTQNKFAKLDLQDTDNPLLRRFGAMASQLDPAGQLAHLAQAVVSVKSDGAPRLLDGVATQPYLVTVDSAKLPGTDGFRDRARFPDQVTFTLFVGPDRLPRRISSDIAGAELTIDYSRWGQRVDVTPPAAAEIGADLALPRPVP